MRQRRPFLGGYVGHTEPTIQNHHTWMMTRIGALLALVVLFVLSPLTAFAETTEDGQEVTDTYFGGTISFEEQNLEGVVVSISGNGFSAETTTDADGKWRLYVPEKDTYTLKVDESTLPEGVIVAGESAEQEVTFDLTNRKIINLFLGEGVRQTVSIFDQALSSLVTGITFGLILALASMGAALVFGTTRLTNFTHGEMVTWGALITIVCTSFWNLPLWLGLLAAVIGGALLGLALDASTWRPLRRRGLGTIQLMIVSIGLSLALRYVFQFILGPTTVQLPGASPTPWEIGPIRLSYINAISMLVSLIVIGFVIYFLRGTRLGKATRAISDNPELAAASGINVDRVIRIVWILAGTLAAVAGVLWGYFRPGVVWDMGTALLLFMFSAITLGGLGNALGALFASLILGIVVELSPVFGLPSDLKYASALVVLIVVLIFKPQGLFGSKERLG